MKYPNKCYYQIINTHDNKRFANKIIYTNICIALYNYFEKIYEQTMTLKHHLIYNMNLTNMMIQVIFNNEMNIPIVCGNLYYDFNKNELCGAEIDEEIDIKHFEYIINEIKMIQKHEKNTETNTKSCLIVDNISKELLLKEQQINEQHKLNNMQEPHIVIEKNKNKNIEKMMKEKNEEKQRIFMNDINVYKNIKKDLENKSIQKIPELFEYKYAIFNILDEENMLESSHNYNLFEAMYDENENNSQKININENNEVKNMIYSLFEK